MLDRRLFVDRTEQTTDDELNVTSLTKMLRGSCLSLYDACEVVKQTPQHHVIIKENHHV